MAGGSHLPDITVISPVFNMDEIVFFVASRGHHADIGGITPGSMPPNSTKLKEEGAAIKSFKLVEDNHFQEEGISKILLEQGEYLGTRCLKDNISDLKAQVAANNYGIKLVQGLIGEFSLDVVHAYMKYITDNAEESVKELLKSLKTDRLKAIDYLDDGSPICLTINIRQKEGTAEFDFSGKCEDYLSRYWMSTFRKLECSSFSD
jgi:5-oxoprolinase (ATP-hydrolysing)